MPRRVVRSKPKDRHETMDKIHDCLCGYLRQLEPSFVEQQWRLVASLYRLSNAAHGGAYPKSLGTRSLEKARQRRISTSTICENWRKSVRLELEFKSFTPLFGGIAIILHWPLR